jgi:Putative DNA-binding domain
MSDLLSFQQRFAEVLESPGLVLATSPLLRAIRVHRNTAMKAALDALTDNYPVVRALVGEEAFAACAASFVGVNPPTDPRLCLYGAKFDAFLSGYVPFVEVSWLAGVARLEWLRIEALFAADAPPLDLSSAKGAISVDTRLKLHPAVRMLVSDAPVASLWLAHQPSADADAIERVEWLPEIALVTRPADRVIIRVADPGAAAFLSACARGEPLGEAAHAANEAAGDVAKVFAGLIGAGAFLSFQIGELHESV